MGFSLIKNYFPGIDQLAAVRFERLKDLYIFWNEKINVISRKDIDNLYVNHILHSLSLSMVIPLVKGDRVLDIGTGGGFPGIPLAILYPDVNFTLIDSRGKKISVVKSIASELELNNIDALHIRAENFRGAFQYVVSRAVSSFPVLVRLSAGKFAYDKDRTGDHGLYSLKGGDLKEELAGWNDKVRIFNISSFFNEEFFMTKNIVFLPATNFPSRD